MKRLKQLFSKFSEGVVAIMLATIFLTFLLQIFSRYVLQESFAWTLEVCLTLWLWLIFWGNSFVLKHNDHITFDVLYDAVKPSIRRLFALISALSIVVAIAISIYPTWDFISFLKIKPSTILGIPMRNVFIIYIVFLFAMVITYSIRIIQIIRFGVPEPTHHSELDGNHS